MDYAGGMADFFFYGTLLDPGVRAAVVGREVPDAAGEPAVLHGYKRVSVRGVTYPVILPDASDVVRGTVFRGFDAYECARLSRFEGERYGAHRREVALEAGATDRPWVYVPVRRVPALPRPWDYEQWARLHRRRYLAAARQFGRTLPAREIRAREQAWRRLGAV